MGDAQSRKPDHVIGGMGLDPRDASLTPGEGKGREQGWRLSSTPSQWPISHAWVMKLQLKLGHWSLGELLQLAVLCVLLPVDVPGREHIPKDSGSLVFGTLPDFSLCVSSFDWLSIVLSVKSVSLSSGFSKSMGTPKFVPSWLKWRCPWRTWSWCQKSWAVLTVWRTALNLQSLANSA